MMVKKGYKEIKKGIKSFTIPKDWEVKWLNEVADYSGGSQPPKKTFSNENKEGYIRLYQIRDYTGSKEKPVYIPEEKANKITKEGDIIIGRYGASLGKVFRAKEGAYNVAMVKVIPENEKVINDFLLYYFQSKIFQDRLSIGVRAAQSGFNKQDWATFAFPLPSLPEQKKIASILSSVDKAIKKTDEIIEEIKKLKKGLTQELLTKGIGHDEFKETQFGKIPIDWEIQRINKVGKITGGHTPKKSNDEYWGGEIPWLTPSQITNRIINTISDTDEHITKEGLESTSVKLLPEGTVMMSSRATIGECVINEVPMTTNQGFANIICDKDKIDNFFLMYLLQYLKEKLIALAGGSTFLEISRSNVKSFNIPVPPLQEQKKLALILSSVDNIIQKEMEYKDQLKELKKGLMQKLLTGKIRVEVDEED
ncbi:MAG: restriction endonuclease subunit S [Halanaerobiales bacterium]